MVQSTPQRAGMPRPVRRSANETNALTRPAGAPAPRGFLARIARATEIRLLPVLIAVATVALGVRVGDVALRLSEGESLITFESARAEDPAPAKPEEKAQAESAAKPAEDAAAASEPAAAEAIVPSNDVKPALDFSASEIAVLEALAARRTALEKREKDMNDREALIKAAELRVEQKIGELNGLRADIEKLLKRQNAEQEAQLGNLVKIYETMKPKDAARIFDDMEMAVLLEVLERMKAQKTAPILAAMSSRKANDVTRQLAQRRSLPEAEPQQAAAPR
jgi:flagellar motility protein MotE (MotC chaperone)